MGSRMLPVDCEHCGGVVDWGDFGPDPDDASVGTTCKCECICRHEREGTPTSPRRVMTLHEDCPFHGRKGSPEDWEGTDD